MIPLTRPCFDEAEERAVVEVLRSGWVTQGPRVAEFEARFAEAVEAAEGVAVTSATTALFLSLHALGIGPGDEVIVPAATFIASVNAVHHLGATPVLVDVDPQTFNITADGVAGATGPRTRAVIAVHQVGQPADLGALEAVARREGIALVEDAACAVGSRYRGRAVGDGRNPACFSFHPRKVLVTGEGGMITTRDVEFAARLRRLRHQGMSVSDLERHRSGSAVPEHFDEAGFNFRMTDLQAAVGLAQLAKLDDFVERRRALAARYDEALADGPLTPPFVPEWAHCNYQSYLVRWRGATRERRDALLAALMERGVSARRGLMAVHLEKPYADPNGPARHAGPLPHSEAIDADSLVLPLYPSLSDSDLDRVVDVLLGAVRELA